MNFFNRQDNLTLDNEAADWLVRLEDHEPEIQEKFFAWLKKSPRHVQAYLGIAGTFRILDHLDPQRRIDVQALIAEANSNVVPIRGNANPSEPATSDEATSPSSRRHLWLIACSMLVFASVGWLFAANFPWGGETFETAVGERREIKLDDGSIVTLNTRSRMQVSFSKHARDIRLLQGEAMFAVAKDANRPFRVDAGGSTIQAIGTQFNVYRRDSGTTVTVVEGVVQISANDSAVAPSASSAGPESETSAAATGTTPVRLSAGEVASVVTDGHVVKDQAPDVEREIAWQKRELVFADDSLDFVAEQFNRYNKQQIRLDGDAVRSKRISGIFSADYPQSLTLFLESDPSLAVEHRGDELVIRAN